MTNSAAYLRWLDCDCDACKALAEVAHDKTAWEAQLEAAKQACPNWQPDIYDDAPQQELFR